MEETQMENVFIMDHPLIQHKISLLRDKNTGTNEFRKLIEEIAVLMVRCGRSIQGCTSERNTCGAVHGIPFLRIHIYDCIQEIS